MAVLFTILHGVGACAALIERGVAGFGGQIRRYRQISPRPQFPKASGCDTGHHQA